MGGSVQGRRTFTASTSVQRSNNSSTPESTPKSKTKSRSRPLGLSVAAATALATAWWASGSGSKDESLNDTRFTAFDIVSNEPVSPTAFVLTIRSRDSELAKNSAKLKAAWEHGQWSVEFKQPQLQIARHYTPLPPLEGEDGADGQLRFLVRKMQGGEMSNYLSRMNVGDQVWLRGPHHGFDIPKRLGDAREVVFLAGGTGIAPALQMVHKLLDTSSVSVPGSAKPSIRILWANRRSVDCVAREEFQGQRKADHEIQSVFLHQILEMKHKHGDHFNIDYFVDDEKKFIGVKEVDAALRSAGTKKVTPTRQLAEKNCRWHSAKLLAISTDEDDGQTTDAACTCPQERAGRKIVCVSGPDGFIEAFAGPKRWTGGRELQGPVSGVLGTLKQQGKWTMDDWLVLKM
ncbi:cytochrome c mitochondrial import factor [Apiospora arundinis]